MRDAGIPGKCRFEQTIPSKPPAVPARPALSIRLVPDVTGGGGAVRPRGAGGPHGVHFHSRWAAMFSGCAPSPAGTCCASARRSAASSSLPASATGRSLLARLPDDTIRDMFAGGWPIPSATAPQNMDELIARIHDVRRTGLSESNDESNRGVGALATAVGDPQTGRDHQHVRHLSRRDHHAGRARDHRQWPAVWRAVHRDRSGRQALSCASAGSPRFTTEVADHARSRALAHRIRYRRYLHRLHPL